MTDEDQPDVPSDAGESVADAADESGLSDESLDKAKQVASDAINRMSSSEQLIALGALLIILISDLIGNILTDNYGPERTLWAVAAAALLLIWAGRFANQAAPAFVPWLTKAMGYLGGLLGIRQLLADIDATVYDGGSILFALVLYVGAGLMAIGANALKTSA